jgi:lysophospholipase L1-like esterase
MLHSRRAHVLAGYAALGVALVAVVIVVAPWEHSAAPAVAAPTAAPAATTPSPPPAPTADLATSPFPRVGADPTGGTGWFLVIGDSISFGFTVDPARFGTNSSWVAQLLPQLGAAAPVPDVLACPGETTASYASGCPMPSLVPWLGATSQREAALTAVRGHRSTLRFVVVELGSNDLLNARRDGIAGPAVLAGLQSRLAGIVTDLRAAAPGVPVVVANLYDPFGAGDLMASAGVAQANAVIAAVAARHGAAVADFHAAINGGAEPLGALVDQAHGDVHPTVEGHHLLARAVLDALSRLGIRSPRG